MLAGETEREAIVMSGLRLYRTEGSHTGKVKALSSSQFLIVVMFNTGFCLRVPEYGCADQARSVPLLAVAWRARSVWSRGMCLFGEGDILHSKTLHGRRYDRLGAYDTCRRDSYELGLANILV